MNLWHLFAWMVLLPVGTLVLVVHVFIRWQDRIQRGIPPHVWWWQKRRLEREGADRTYAELRRYLEDR